MLRKTPFLAVLLFGSSLSFSASEAVVDLSETAPTSTMASSFNKQLAVVFSKKSTHLTVKKAYHLQKAFVKNSVAKGADIVGFKAGLTNDDGAKNYGLTQAISGVLLQAPLRGDKAVINSRDTVNLMLEQEFAFLIAKPINGKITQEQLIEYIAAIAPAIEIPQVNFLANDFNGLDIIANNAMAYKVMIAEWQSVELINELDNIAVSLSCDGKMLTQGKGSNTLQGQKKALLWLINHIIDQGYKIQKDQILISGNLVKMISAKPCVYQANFGKLGTMELLIE
jgi:2-keto-4-pentenoate hydratase